MTEKFKYCSVYSKLKYICVGFELLTAVVYEEFYLLGNNAVRSAESQPMFRNKMTPPPSEVGYSSILKLEAKCSFETLNFNGINGVIFEKVKVFAIIIFMFQILEIQIETVCSDLKIQKREICGKAKTENAVLWM